MELTEGERELLRDGISQKIPDQNFDEEEPPGPHLPTLVLLLMNSRHPSNSLDLQLSTSRKTAFSAVTCRFQEALIHGPRSGPSFISNENLLLTWAEIEGRRWKPEVGSFEDTPCSLVPVGL